MDDYENIVDFIVEEMKRQNMKYCNMANKIGVYRTTMREYYYKNRQMPAIVIINCLEVLGYRLEVKHKHV